MRISTSTKVWHFYTSFFKADIGATLVLFVVFVDRGVTGTSIMGASFGQQSGSLKTGAKFSYSRVHTKLARLFTTPPACPPGAGILVLSLFWYFCSWRWRRMEFTAFVGVDKGDILCFAPGVFAFMFMAFVRRHG